MTSRRTLSPRAIFWLIVAGIVGVLFVVSLRIYQPGYLVQFSDTIYPVRPDLTLSQWMRWWSTDNLGAVWYEACWLTNLIVPFLAMKLGMPLGLGQALQYFTWLAVPTVAVAFCIDRLSSGRPNWLSALVVATLTLNIYIAESWTSSVAMYAFGAAALYAWALVECIECGKLGRGLLVAAAAAFWLAPDASNPPYFLLVMLHSAVFGLWLLFRNRKTWREGLRIGGLVLGVSLLVGARWIIPLVPFYSYPLTSVATGGGSYDFVINRAHLINVLRFSPFWYWGDPHYTYYALLYERNPLMIFGSFLPFLVILAALAQAIRKNSRTLVALFAIVFAWIFLIKSSNVPFAGLSQMINALPLMSLFRDSEKFTGPLLIDMTVATGLAFATIEFRRFVIAALGAAVAAGTVAGGWLVLTGTMFTGERGIPPLYVQVPQAYTDLQSAVAQTGAHRVVTTPWDQYYEVGTKWGFLGADTEFFNDLPDRPLFHHVVFGYVDHDNLDAFVALYHRAAWGDAVARTALDRRAGIDAAIFRNDATPYLGWEHYEWRDGDVSQEFAPRSATNELAVYSARTPLSLAYESPAAFYAPSTLYISAVSDVTQLGISGVPLISADNLKPVPHAIELREFGAPELAITKASVPYSAFLFNPRGLRGGSFAAAPGAYDVVLRAAHSAARIFVPQQPAAPVPRDSQMLILGESSDLSHDYNFAEPSGAAFTFLNEGTSAAGTTLELPLLGQSKPTCGRVSIGKQIAGKYLIPPGRSVLAANAVVPPGPFEVTVQYGEPGACAPSPGLPSPLYTSLAAPPSVLGAAVPVSLRRTWSRSYPVDMTLDQYPKVQLDYSQPQSQVINEPTAIAVSTPAPASLVLRARIEGAGCTAIVADVGTDKPPATLDVVRQLDDINRRPFLPAACIHAAPAQLHVTRVDLIAIGASNQDLANLQALTIRPARPAVEWHPLASAQQTILPAGTPLGTHTVWRFPIGGVSLWDHPIVDFTGSSCDGVHFGFATELPGGTNVDVDNLYPYLLLSDANNPQDYDPYPHAQIPLTDLAVSGGAPIGVMKGSIALQVLVAAQLTQPCTLKLDGAMLGVDAPPSAAASVTIDGTTLAVPRDDLPHRYRVTLRGDRHRLSVNGPLELGGVFAAGLLDGARTLPGDAGGVDTDVAAPGWVLYSQAYDRAWAAHLGGDSLQQYRADVDMQAYYAPAAGHLRVAFWLGALRPIAELITWLSLIALVILCVLPIRALRNS